VVDPAAEQPRADAFEISPSGPMPGWQMTWPQGEVLAIEHAALAALDLPVQVFAELPYGLLRGERRPLRVPLIEPAAGEIEGDLQLSFGLPRGSYATA